MSVDQTHRSAFDKAISGTGIAFASQIIGAITVLLAQRAILSTITKDANGELFALQQFGSLLMGILVEAGMTNVAMRFVIRDSDSADEILATFLKLRFVLWAICTVVLAVGAYVLAPEFTLTAFFFSLYFLISARTLILRSVFEVRFRARTELKLVSATAVLDGLFFLILIALDVQNLTPHRIIMWYLISSAPGFVIVLIASKDWKLVGVPFSPKISKKLVSETIPIAISGALIYVHDKSDTLFLQLFSTEEQTGIYGAAYRVVYPLSMVVWATISGFFPIITRLQKEDIDKCRKVVFQVLKLLMLIGTMFSLALTIGTPWVIQLMSKGKYADNALEFAMFFWVVVPSFLLQFIMVVNIALGEQRKNYTITGALAGASIIANLALTATFAAPGAIVAKIVANIVAAIPALILLQQFLTTAWLRTFLIKFAVLICCAGSFGVLLPMYFSTLTSLLLAAPLFVGAVAATRMLSKKELDFFISTIKGMVTKALGKQNGDRA